MSHFESNEYDFGAIVRKRMNELGINQTELAKRMNAAQSTVSYYLTKNKSKTKPSLDTLYKFADALNISIDYFLQGPTQLKGTSDVLQSKITGDKAKKTQSNTEKVSEPHEVAKEILDLFDKYQLSFGEVFEVISILRKNTMKMAAMAANNIPYQRISGGK